MNDFLTFKNYRLTTSWYHRLWTFYCRKAFSPKLFEHIEKFNVLQIYSKFIPFDLASRTCPPTMRNMATLAMTYPSLKHEYTISYIEVDNIFQ